MYIILNKLTHTPKSITFGLEQQERHIYTFATRAKAKHFMRNKVLDKKDFEIMFMTKIEMEKL